jgi:hypothetical protein
MKADLSMFRERLAEACRVRDKSELSICRQIGLGSRRSVNLALTGSGAIDLWQLCRIADRLEVSLDWLTGRSNVMDLLELPEEYEHRPPAKSASKRRPKAD